jgi:ribosomal protein S19E (S16A)
MKPTKRQADLLRAVASQRTVFYGAGAKWVATVYGDLVQRRTAPRAYVYRHFNIVADSWPSRVVLACVTAGWVVVGTDGRVSLTDTGRAELEGSDVRAR